MTPWTAACQASLSIFIFLLKYYNQIFFPFVRLSWRWISESKWLGHNFKLWWIDTEFHNITYYWCPEWTPGVGDGQGGLACWDSWGCKELDMTEQLNWTELKKKTEETLSMCAEVTWEHSHLEDKSPQNKPTCRQLDLGLPASRTQPQEPWEINFCCLKNKSKTSSFDRDVGKLEFLHSVGGNVKWCSY